MSPTPSMETAEEAVSDRLVAYLIDFVILSAGATAVWGIGFGVQIVLLGAGGGMEPGSDPSAAASVGAILIRVVVWTIIAGLVFGYFTVMDAGGQTVGRSQQDVVVATTDGDLAGKKHTALRTAVLLVPLPVMAGASILLSFLGFGLTVPLMFGWLGVEALVLYVSDSSQRLGDRLASTQVVRTGGEGAGTSPTAETVTGEA
jgi:uncharacterized RDD family membrane protein YckC